MQTNLINKKSKSENLCRGFLPSRKPLYCVKCFLLGSVIAAYLSITMNYLYKNWKWISLSKSSNVVSYKPNITPHVGSRVTYKSANCNCCMLQKYDVYKGHVSRSTHHSRPHHCDPDSHRVRHTLRSFSGCRSRFCTDIWLQSRPFLMKQVSVISG